MTDNTRLVRQLEATIKELKEERAALYAERSTLQQRVHQLEIILERLHAIVQGEPNDDTTIDR